MKLHIQQCEKCKRIRLRTEGDDKWCALTRFDMIDDIRKQHEVLSEVKIVCADCNTVGRNVIAEMAGQTC